MKWPKEIIEAFNLGTEIKPTKGKTIEDVILYILNETMRRAVGRAHSNPEILAAIIDQPYTLLGSVIPELGNIAEEIKLNKNWFPAINKLYDYVRKNTDDICKAFRDEAVGYDDKID